MVVLARSRLGVGTCGAVPDLFYPATLPDLSLTHSRTCSTIMTSQTDDNRSDDEGEEDEEMERLDIDADTTSEPAEKGLGASIGRVRIFLSEFFVLFPSLHARFSICGFLFPRRSAYHLPGPHNIRIK